MATAGVVVDVGAEVHSLGGAFQFRPNTISAPNGTVVTFNFTGSPGNHSVTQSSFAQPCVPLPGGLDSGFRRVLSHPDGFPQWNITVDDDQTPLWFFCRQLDPSSHCNAGMVAVINAPQSGTESFTAFQSAAEAVASQTSSTSAHPTRGHPQITSSSVATSAPHRKHLLVPAIIASIVGSLIVLLLCVAAIFIIRRRASRRNDRQENIVPHPLWPGTILDPARENGFNARPAPLVLDEKRARAHVEQFQAGGSSSTAENPSGSASEPAVPTAAELAALAEEMRLLRSQVQRLGSERNLPGSSSWAEDEQPPEYVPR
ncbi:hypothetical protein C8R44DRAFT_681257 [Mycena epipterygia]|nr:hypothetical protein C8R44DRAFT_681257 [Mycena epipterygia]